MKKRIKPSMASARKEAEALHARSEKVLNEAYKTLLRSAKARGMTVEELIEERKNRRTGK